MEHATAAIISLSHSQKSIVGPNKQIIAYLMEVVLEALVPITLSEAAPYSLGFWLIVWIQKSVQLKRRIEVIHNRESQDSMANSFSTA